jgi:4-diphosphocytidyl-2-C-methyl-D-erythritol kinase
MATRVRSFSKINLGLAIGPPRADGFHGLTTLYQTLDLHDVVTVEAKLLAMEDASPEQSRISLTTNHAGVPTDGRNTAWKMVELALIRMGVVADVKLHIQKELPVQGGMGAGSANAAAALLGLERELGLEVPDRQEIAAAVGSDVPLFLIGGAVLGTGRGEVVEAMPDLPATWCVIAVPEVGVSTPRAFKDWDELQTKVLVGTEDTALTSLGRPDRLEELSHVYASVFGARTADTSGIVRGPDSIPEKQQVRGDTRNDLAENTLLALVRTGIENDFETVVFPQYPLLREIKHELMGTSVGVSSGTPADSNGNALYAALSGSGSALFGLYRSESDARAAQQRVQATGCKALLTETLPRQEYWRRMFAE